MADRFTPEHRSKIMAAVRSRDTVPERKVRSIAHRLGFRFSLRRSDLPGRPDLVFPRLRSVIFVHGCFWHRHPGCSRASSPATNRAFWEAKFERNILRDADTLAQLHSLGWKSLVVWECDLKEPDDLARRIKGFLIAPLSEVPPSPKNGVHRKRTLRT